MEISPRSRTLLRRWRGVPGHSPRRPGRVRPPIPCRLRGRFSGVEPQVAHPASDQVLLSTGTKRQSYAAGATASARGPRARWRCARRCWPGRANGTPRRATGADDELADAVRSGSGRRLGREPLVVVVVAVDHEVGAASRASPNVGATAVAAVVTRREQRVVPDRGDARARVRAARSARSHGPEPDRIRSDDRAVRVQE